MLLLKYVATTHNKIVSFILQVKNNAFKVTNVSKGEQITSTSSFELQETSGVSFKNLSNLDQKLHLDS